MNITQKRLKELLRYDPETGDFYRIGVPKRATGGRTDLIGKKAGYTDSRGRVTISVDGHDYFAHRLAILYMTGAFPKSGVDHHRDRVSNKWGNLRPASQSQNLANSRKQVGTSSRYKGVTWDKQKKKWLAQITYNYQHIFIGRFSDEKSAHLAYCKKARELFGQFARAA